MHTRRIAAIPFRDVECVRSRKAPNTPAEAGYSHSVALCMTIAALKTGQRVTFEDAKQEVLAGGSPVKAL